MEHGVRVDGVRVATSPNTTILDVCRSLGLRIPTFCFHMDLTKSGNCRICLVELENSEKLVVSCLTMADEGMSILTNSPSVMKARLTVFQSLLLNHPLDCPICDQAGECDLQDESKNFGSNYSKNFHVKRSSDDKYCGPLIKTIMTRCITCTRCVRYAEEITGVNYFGTLNRGESTEIGSYIHASFDSELSGNVIDLCPVGALTAKPSSFKARPWELNIYETIDISDSLGSSIYVNYIDLNICRVLPKSNYTLNKNIITDKARFSYDANNNDRVYRVYKKGKISNWEEIMSDSNYPTYQSFRKNNLKTNSYTKKELDVFLTEDEPLESLIYLKDVKNVQPFNINIINLDTIYKNTNLYIGDNLSILEILLNIKTISLFLGSNLRLENSILNARLRMVSQSTHLLSYALGNTHDNNLNSTFLNLNFMKILNIFEGLTLNLSKVSYFAQQGLVFLGITLRSRLTQFNNFIKLSKQSFPQLKIISVSCSSNSDGLAWLNINDKLQKTNNKKILINSRETTLTKKLIGNNFSFFLTSHISSLISKSVYTIPVKSSLEVSNSYLNLEHKYQTTLGLRVPHKEAKSVLIACTHLLGPKRKEIHLWKKHLNETENRHIKNKENTLLKLLKKLKYLSCGTFVYVHPLKTNLKNTYFSTNLLKSSKVMQDCTKLQLNKAWL